MDEALFLAALFFGAAVLYSSVGHAGASAYLALMALFGLAPAVMRPTALVLNILVASLATYRYRRAGYLDWRVLWPFVITSIPLAFVGGAIQLPGTLYRQVVGVILLLAAARFLLPGQPVSRRERSPSLPRLPAMAVGGAIGLLSGLTGTGGGIFLSPFLLLIGWADVRITAGVSAAFILANSASGLAGNLASVGAIPPEIGWWGVSVLLGGLVGTELGSRRLATPILVKLLAVVLVIAGLKLVLS